MWRGPYSRDCCSRSRSCCWQSFLDLLCLGLQVRLKPGFFDRWSQPAATAKEEGAKTGQACMRPNWANTRLLFGFCGVVIHKGAWEILREGLGDWGRELTESGYASFGRRSSVLHGGKHKFHRCSRLCYFMSGGQGAACSAEGAN